MTEDWNSDRAGELHRWSATLAGIARTGLAFTESLYEQERFEEVLAVAGSAVPPPVVEELDRTGRATRELVSVMLAMQYDRGLRLRHALVGDALASRLSGDDRRQRHRRLAMALEAAGDVVERVWLLDPPPPFASDDAETRAVRARRVAEHISVLWRGRIVESGPAEELFASDNPFVRQFLSGESQGPLGME